MLYVAILYYSILVSGMGSGFCRALGSGLGWRLGPSSPRSPPGAFLPHPPSSDHTIGGWAEVGGGGQGGGGGGLETPEA